MAFDENRRRENGQPRPPERGDAPSRRGAEEPTELGPLPAILRTGIGKIVLVGVAVVVVAGFVVGLARDDLRVIVGALLLPVLVYLTVMSQRDRRRDEERRRYFDRTGRWPSGGSA